MNDLKNKASASTSNTSSPSTAAPIDAFSEFSTHDQKMIVELLNSIIEEQGLSPIKE